MAYLEQNVSGQLLRIPLDPKAITYVTSDGPRLEITLSTGAEALAAFYRSKRYFVLFGLGHAPIFVNQCKVSLIKIIREGDDLAIGAHNVTFHELIIEDLREDGELISKHARCPVGGEYFKPEERVVYCPSCETAYHERCWHFQKGRCASRVCDYQAPLG